MHYAICLARLVRTWLAWFARGPGAPVIVRAVAGRIRTRLTVILGCVHPHLARPFRPARWAARSLRPDWLAQPCARASLSNPEGFTGWRPTRRRPPSLCPAGVSFMLCRRRVSVGVQARAHVSRGWGQRP